MGNQVSPMPEPGEQTLCVLVVDDAVGARLSLSSLLRVAGFTAYEASDAAQALVLMESSLPVDVLVTDVDMPGAMDGLALAEHVRRHWPAVAVVVASAGDHTAAVRDPEVLLLRKPYKPERLLGYLEEKRR
ncbi:MAG TPA: response regulator [Tahibacter sp.]|nr:response regulator [Tahibacter sp.]